MDEIIVMCYYLAVNLALDKKCLHYRPKNGNYSKSDVHVL